MDGLILVNKPKGITSHDIVIRIRKILSQKKIGHFGTLDPLATGLLVVAVGKATRLFPFYLHSAKTYQGRIRLGFSTDTYDSEGKSISKETKTYPDKKVLLDNMKKFLGENQQIPPPYSAKKYKGVALYKRVREKKEYQLKPQTVVIHFFRLKGYSPPYVDFEVKCSSGTYIRSIAHDLGQILGCGAYLNQLKRTEIGEFSLTQSFTLEEIDKMFLLGRINQFLHPMENLLPELPKIVVNDKVARLARSGCEFYPDPMPASFSSHNKEDPMPEKKPDVYRIFDSQGKLFAFAAIKAENNSLHPFLVFDSQNSSR
jgi:tRNA pseudouridine55 synthase